MFPEPYTGRWSGWSLLKRFAIGAVVIFSLSAATVASAVLLEVKEVTTIIKDESVPLAVQVRSQLKHVAPGKPQTILVIGDDRRKADIEQHNPTRSDTMILIRLDPKRGATAMMSLPRDLLVTIPGHGVDKLNAAFSYGEDALTLRTIRSLLGIPIHHYVRVTFRGFKDAVDRLGCVYVDVDRRYFNDNRPPVGGGGAYAAIDVPAGYQKLCGARALDYVRYRHLDSDLVRAARQQSFLGQAKDQIGVSGVFADRRKLLHIFARSVRTDIRSSHAVLSLLKLVAESSSKPVAEVPFPALDAPDGSGNLEISPYMLQTTVKRFLAAKGSKKSDEADDQHDGSPDDPHVESPAHEASRERVGRERHRPRPPAQPHRGRGRGRPPAGQAPDLAARLRPAPARRGRPLPQRLLARLHDHRPRRRPPPRVPDRRVRGLDRPVLRDRGHDLEVAADPRRPLRAPAHAAGGRTSSSRTTAGCGWSRGARRRRCTGSRTRSCGR